jgi:hypothetical protein
VRHRRGIASGATPLHRAMTVAQSQARRDYVLENAGKNGQWKRPLRLDKRVGGPFFALPNFEPVRPLTVWCVVVHLRTVDDDMSVGAAYISNRPVPLLPHCNEHSFCG